MLGEHVNAPVRTLTGTPTLPRLMDTTHRHREQEWKQADFSIQAQSLMARHHDYWQEYGPESLHSCFIRSAHACPCYQTLSKQKAR